MRPQWQKVDVLGAKFGCPGKFVRGLALANPWHFFQIWLGASRECQVELVHMLNPASSANFAKPTLHLFCSGANVLLQSNILTPHCSFKILSRSWRKA